MTAAWALPAGGFSGTTLMIEPPAGSAQAAVKAALSNWTTGQASVFGTRGITVNAVATGAGLRESPS
ncbi:hypothetical protein JHV675_54340 [Mycobacterium avium subsp. hominissuis]